MFGSLPLSIGKSAFEQRSFINLHWLFASIALASTDYFIHAAIAMLGKAQRARLAMATFEKQFTLDSPTGAALQVNFTPTTGNAIGIVHINHGLAEHSMRYARFAHALSQAGFAVFAHDHRGHGHTKAPDAPLGTFSTKGNGVDLLIEDCAAVQDYARAQFPNLPLIMFGHSMGGLITMNYVLRKGDKLDAAAVWNSNFSGGLLGHLARTLLKYERFRLGSDVPSQILPKLTFGAWGKQIKNRRTNFDWLSHIETEVDAYIADPLCGWDGSVGLWLDLFDMIFAGGDVADASFEVKVLPLMLLGGGQDPATDKGIAVSAQAARLKMAGFHHVELNLLPDARHETLNDVDQDKATALFIEFATKACNRPAKG